MFQKVLINDDHDAIIENVAGILNQNNVSIIEKAQYCDEAYLKIKRASLEKSDYDLLITDLSFLCIEPQLPTDTKSNNN